MSPHHLFHRAEFVLSLSDTWARRQRSLCTPPHIQDPARVWSEDLNEVTLPKHLGQGYRVCTAASAPKTIQNEPQVRVTHIGYLGQISTCSSRQQSRAAASPTLQGSVKGGHKQRNKAQGGNRQKEGVERGWRGRKSGKSTPLCMYIIHLLSVLMGP